MSNKGQIFISMPIEQEEGRKLSFTGEVQCQMKVKYSFISIPIEQEEGRKLSFTGQVLSR